MGQYYRVVNVDKKQVMCPFDYDNGQKLTEWSYRQNYMVVDLMNLLAGPWKGDRVCVVGDYADTEDPEEYWYETYASYVKELGIEGKMDKHGYPITLYRYSDDNFECIKPLGGNFRPDHWEKDGTPVYKPEISVNDPGYRYIYNHATKQVIDLDKCPVEWVWFDKDTKECEIMNLSPLPLLLAMGNGRGGGDYRGSHKGDRTVALVGTWCSTAPSIEVSIEQILGTAGYEEFRPDFTENNPVIPYDQVDEVIKKEMEAQSA